MLVLSRRIGESITIGDQIEVTVLEVKGEQVKIGIKAPQDIEIHRQEVYENIKNENKQAVGFTVDIKHFLDGK